jgi:hypothetical protein
LGLCSRFSDLKKCPPEKLQLRIEDVLDSGELQHWKDDFPMSLQIGDEQCEIRYSYAPGSKDDGATLLLRPMDLALIQQRTLESCVPAWLEERLRIAQETLPKAFKKEFQPDQARGEWMEIWDQSPEQGLEKILDRWMSRHTGLRDTVEAWLKLWNERCPQYTKPALALLNSDGTWGERNWSVQDSQLHNLASMEERHLFDFKKRNRKKCGNSNDNPLQLLETALDLIYRWPSDGIEASNLKGGKIQMMPRLYWHKEALWCEPEQQAEKAWRDSLLCCARLHGPLGRHEPNPDAQLLDRLAKSFSDLAELKQKSMTASWEYLWLRMRPADLKNLKTLRERLKKIEEKYWDRDLKKLLELCDACGALWMRSKWLHPQTSQEHWLFRLCAKVSFSGRPDPSALVDKNLEDSHRDIQRCLNLLEEQHRSPNSFDEVCKAWRQVEKDWEVLSSRDLYSNVFVSLGTWEADLLETDWQDASPKTLKEIQRLLQERSAQLDALQKNWQESEAWLSDAQDDVNAEHNAKTRARKQELLAKIQQEFEGPAIRKQNLKAFLEAVQALREQWVKLKSQKKVVMAEEKIVGGDKLKAALLTAWSAKSKS